MTLRYKMIYKICDISQKLYNLVNLAVNPMEKLFIY